MGQNARVPSVPLITSDPYFSLWSPSDRLFEASTVHWTGKPKALIGLLCVDGRSYRFLGDVGGEALPVQTGLVITPTASVYTFEAGGAALTVTFRTPLLLDDLELVSRPCSYIDFSVVSVDGNAHNVKVGLSADEGFCYDGSSPKPMICGQFQTKAYDTVWMGQSVQRPLCHSGDDITIDWGTLYLAVKADGRQSTSHERRAHDGRLTLTAGIDFGSITAPANGSVVIAYDDVLSIMYFSHAAKGYWARNGRTIFDTIGDSIIQHDSITQRCEAFDSELSASARETAGEEYERICALAYRQSIAAHKLIEDENGEIIFLSRENFSNGCLGTSDVSYPSVPLYLLYNPELVSGMLRPIFRFARCPVWKDSFAPHDVGRYPYATGQVYALRAPQGVAYKTNGIRMANGEVYPQFYAYPAEADVYDVTHQMPVEECGNMLVMTAAVVLYTGDVSLAKENSDLLKKWADYLLENGADPGNQLCTDDFSGHLAHNVNLAGKAVMGVMSWALLLEKLDRTAEAKEYEIKARAMAADFEKRADAGEYTALTFEGKYGWSVKYNLVWDKIFGTKLFSDELYQKEISWYLKMQKPYGIPLDPRNDYTKSDWLAWAAAMAPDKADMAAILKPIASFLQDTPDRVPFTDFYFASTARHRSMQNRSVQGGLFMPILKDKSTVV